MFPNEINDQIMKIGDVKHNPSLKNKTTSSDGETFVDFVDSSVFIGDHAILIDKILQKKSLFSDFEIEYMEENSKRSIKKANRHVFDVEEEPFMEEKIKEIEKEYEEWQTKKRKGLDPKSPLEKYEIFEKTIATNFFQ